MWSRIWTTCPENPHCGNCGVPFMNSTTSFDFTSLSINCSMLILASFCGIAFRAGIGPVTPDTAIYVPQTVVHPKQNGGELACRGPGPPALPGARPQAGGHHYRVTERLFSRTGAPI